MNTVNATEVAELVALIRSEIAMLRTDLEKIEDAIGAFEAEFSTEDAKAAFAIIDEASLRHYTGITLEGSKIVATDPEEFARGPSPRLRGFLGALAERVA